MFCMSNTFHSINKLGQNFVFTFHESFTASALENNSLMQMKQNQAKLVALAVC